MQKTILKYKDDPLDIELSGDQDEELQQLVTAIEEKGKDELAAIVAESGKDEVMQLNPTGCCYTQKLYFLQHQQLWVQ